MYRYGRAGRRDESNTTSMASSSQKRPAQTTVSDDRSQASQKRPAPIKTTISDDRSQGSGFEAQGLRLRALKRSIANSETLTGKEE